MTLIVYANDKFYADDLSLVNPRMNSVQRRHGTVKARISKNEFAMVVCGPFPREKDKSAVAVGLRKLAFFSDQGSEDPIARAFTQEQFDTFTRISNIETSTTYLFATKRNLYKLERGGLTILDRKKEYHYGSGQYCYGICRKAGLSVEESYVKVAEYDKTVGKLFTVIDLSNMEDMVDNIVALMRKSRNKVANTTADKVEAIAAYTKKEREQ